MGMGGQRHDSAVLPPRTRGGTCYTGGWVGPGPFWSGAKNFVPTGFDPRTVHPVARRQTNSAIPARLRIISNQKTIG
jgi:hypothetical protein